MNEMPTTDNRDRLLALMRETELASHQVAALLGVHPVTVRNWMIGKYRVPQAALIALQAAKPRRKA